jgi:hypothetical protein
MLRHVRRAFQHDVRSGGFRQAGKPDPKKAGLDGVGDMTELDYGSSAGEGPQQNGPGYSTLTYSSTSGLLTGINDIANGVSILTVEPTMPATRPSDDRRRVAALL